MVSCPKLTPVFLQFLSMGTSIMLLAFGVTSFITLDIAFLVVNLYIMAAGIIIFISDIRAFGIFGYIRFIYTPIGRGLLFILLGCLFIQRSLFQVISGSVLIVVGVIYLVTARVFGGVPKPLLQKNVEELPLKGDLKFVEIPGGIGGGIGGNSPPPPPTTLGAVA